MGWGAARCIGTAEASGEAAEGGGEGLEAGVGGSALAGRRRRAVHYDIVALALRAVGGDLNNERFSRKGKVALLD